MSITALLAGSLALIAAASVTLVYGWANASEPLVVASIAFSAASAVFQAMALYRSKPRGAPRRRARAARSGK
ncbi:MAG: hypothetical protein M3273_05150 [Actinomycetota bacterium]|nr:hypothetical protein [Actinomycetota bacterium]